MRLERFNKPEYFLQPGRAIRRLLGRTGHGKSTRLPWGHVIDVIPGESIGSVLCRSGIFDLALTETLFRLVKPGDCVLDCGANIGYMSSVLAHCCGKAGYVSCFEPNPAVLRVLRANAKRWSLMPGVAPIDVIPKAVGSQKGKAKFLDFGNDSATGRIENADCASCLEVEVTTIDEYASETGRVPSLVKIDTEGHELAAMLGADRTLGDERLSHVIVEDWSFGESTAVQYLRDRGFAIFALDRSWHGPALRSQLAREELPGWEAPNFLATRNASEAIESFRPRGWRCLALRGQR